MNIFQRSASLYGNESRSWSLGKMRSDTSFSILGLPPPMDDQEDEFSGYSGPLEHNNESTESLSWSANTYNSNSWRPHQNAPSGSTNGYYFTLCWRNSDVSSWSWSGAGLQWDVDYRGMKQG